MLQIPMYAVSSKVDESAHLFFNDSYVFTWMDHSSTVVLLPQEVHNGS